MNTVRIAQAQINPTLGDLNGNVDKIARWIDKAREGGADIVTFPELVLCGYLPEDLLIRAGFIKDNWSALQDLIPRCLGICAIVGFPHLEDNKVFNAAAVICDGKLMGIYNKIELPNYGVFDEKRYFHQGSGCLIFSMNQIRFSVTICEDLWIPDSITESCARNNKAHAVLSISASPFHAGKLTLRRFIVERFAKATNTTVFFNNLLGGQDELVFDGGAMVVGPKGEVLASSQRFKEDMLVTDFHASDVSPELPSWNLKLPFMELESAVRTNRIPLENTVAPQFTRVEEIYQALILGTRDYVRKNGFQRVVIGLSGGIDSALTAAIAVDALGRDRVVGVTMPSQYTSGETFSDAAALARNLEIELITVPVRDIFESYVHALAEPFCEGQPGVEFENIQARIRGNILMALSNRFGWLVLTTGNKSEIAVGYSTLYGDMAGGFAVIKDVPKTVVYDLAEYINAQAGCSLIPQSIIDRAPSAELRPDQKDEDSLPPYSVLDPILQEYIEQDKDPEEINDYDPEIVWEIVRMVDCNEYKRRQAPPGVKITPKAFGKDRRLPITNRYLSYKRSRVRKKP
ncbi:NAD+ synthase [Desulfomonile tiedjei]|uniref:Glutamine-dependent NAD(+) synthetase n=1 Tax=Desulfomonile tiedjei (strain ATCC 49306 / DSM 6799 / DCB-1) TaxID=706587 RepID=I4C9L5_DESTA|nr:NAD+ synthase [Desulfomonile tiedjei]AFM26256.1 NAD+ synthetase [Desulfomonile tiedjei DSM 6799]